MAFSQKIPVFSVICPFTSATMCLIKMPVKESTSWVFLIKWPVSGLFLSMSNKSKNILTVKRHLFHTKDLSSTAVNVFSEDGAETTSEELNRPAQVAETSALRPKVLHCSPFPSP